MRNGASTSSSIIVKLAKGTSVKVYSDVNGWSKIEVYGKTGYVSSAFLSVTSQSTYNSPPPAQPTVTKYVAVSAGSSLILRKSASTDSTVVAKLTNGAEVKVYTESNGWAKVQANGQDGYVSSQYLSTTKTGSNNTEQQTTIMKYVNVNPGTSLNMRKGTSQDSSIILKLARGVEVTVYSETNGWAKIAAYGQVGYVSSEFLSQTKLTAGSDTITDTNTNNNTDTNNQVTMDKYVDVIYGSSLNLRSAPSSSASVITKLARGTVVNFYSEANGWAKVTANGQTGYVSSQYLSTSEPFNPSQTPGSIEVINENYHISLAEMTNIQMKVSPQTDKKYDTYIRADAITLNSSTTGIVSGAGWNIRGGAGTDFWTVGKVDNQETLQILGKVKGTDGYDWYQVTYNKTWVNASPEDVAYYLNPDNFENNTVDSLQFLKLSESANIDATEVNERILLGKGILQGLASTFITAGTTYGINELYLISHALLETGNGTSQLATGVQINEKTVYNMYGIGAYDDSAVSSGAQFAYNAGWFTPEDAIIGGAQFIANGYINVGQDTLYKMRWNPSSAVTNGYASHQYATDIGWANKQVNQIYNLYSLIDSYKILQEIPQYN
jgi:mannosyl-glycoprotein endo-beta-N-acetylglucosaminidase